MKTITNTLYLAFALFAFACFALSPPLKAQCPSACGGGGNTALGNGALDSITTAQSNTAAGANALGDDTTGSFNVAVGSSALGNNTVGFQNMAIGAEALLNNIDGNFNMAIGFRALNMNQHGGRNAAVGASALRDNTASDNTAIGSTALRNNEAGPNNTAIGSAALSENTTGHDNTAVGAHALASITGLGNDSNTAVGSEAMLNSSSGLGNTVVGFQAGINNAGSVNTAIGVNALSNSLGNGNIGLGVNAGQNIGAANNVICIGTSGVAISSSCFIGQIFGQSVDGATDTPVIIDNTGKLGTTTSSQRFKKDIQPMDQASEAILSLKPVTFHYKNDNTSTARFGLIAEEVAEVNPDLIVRDDKGEIYSVRYDAVNAMLLNEFLKEHRKVQRLEAALAAMGKRLKEQDAKIERVNDKVEVNKSVSQTVLNNQ